MHQYWQHAPPSKALHPIIITKSFHKLPAETRLQPQAHTYQYDLQKGTYPIPGEYTIPKPLKYKWRDFAYTDGSAIDTSTAKKSNLKETAPLIGAAVFAHADAKGTHADTTLKLCINPKVAKDPYDDTINRAELIAVKHAIQLGYTHIATDSLTTLYQVRKMNRSPQSMQEHRHLQLHRELSQSIQQANECIHIYKVKSHIGIIGNELADELATSVARGTQITHNIIIDRSPSNPRRAEYWPYDPRSPGNAGGEVLPPRPIADMDSTLKTHCHEMHKLGTAKTDTIYYSAASAISAKVDLPASNKFMSMVTIRPKEATNILKLRTGNLYTNKLAYRYGHTTSPRCPLCKQKDGGYHLASGCPTLRDMYTDRHNAAGLLILKAIRSGMHGNTVVQADVGSHDKQTREGLPPLPREIPHSIMPNTVSEEIMTQINDPDSRPDITLYSTDSTDGTTRRKITLVEIKYCVDTKPEDQHAAAQAQHATLMTALEAAPNTCAELITILLGTAGYIYLETHDQLQQLGIQGRALKSLITNLHVQAVKSLTSIVGTRRHAEMSKHTRRFYYCQPRTGHTTADAPTMPKPHTKAQAKHGQGKRKKPPPTARLKRRKRRKKR
jgi:ribonuclease HI